MPTASKFFLRIVFLGSLRPGFPGYEGFLRTRPLVKTELSGY